MRIRIAQKAIGRGVAVDSIEETFVGLMIPWIEIDGVRFDTCVGARISAGVKETTQVTLDLIAVPTFVYLDSDGNELPWPELVDLPHSG